MQNDETKAIVKDLRSEINGMVDKEMVDSKEVMVILEHLDNPRLSIFYGLPKIHKTFKDFPHSDQLCQALIRVQPGYQSISTLS